MNNDDFERLCKSLEQAIAHASGEEVDGCDYSSTKKSTDCVERNAH
jgi:hypothetical protein